MSFTNFLARKPQNAENRAARRENGESRASVASVAAGSLTLYDAKTNKSFLIDTGAEVSVVPASEHERQAAPLKKNSSRRTGPASDATGKKNCDCKSDRGLLNGSSW